MFRWGVMRSLAKRERDQLRQQILKELEKQVSSITRHQDTVRKSVSDWPDIELYLASTFGVDVSDIPIHVTTPDVMKRNGFEECAGCYIDELKLILVKNHITTNAPSKGKFSQRMDEVAGSTMEPEDVVVHELLHAVSHKIRGIAGARARWYESAGGGIKYRVAEEEFVYTNCMPYYRSKGMTDEQVVGSIFLPFCIGDVMSDRSYILGLFKDIGMVLPAKESCGIKEYRSKVNRLMNKHADALVPCIVDEAKNRAFKMIDLYQRYGAKTVQTDPISGDVGDRISALDLDDDF